MNNKQSEPIGIFPTIIIFIVALVFTGYVLRFVLG